LYVLLAISVGNSESQVPEPRRSLNQARAPVSVAWTTGTGKWVGFWGRRESVLCPPGQPEGAWGTDVYTDDSSICTAAVHAGLISTKDGGVVTIEMRPDVGQYGGSTRYGVQTGDWMEPWTGAYVFVRNHTTIEPAIAATSLTQADSWAGQAGRVLTFLCDSNVELHTVYGTDIYTDDSYVCSAAVHRGITTQKSGGLVTIQLLDGYLSFTGSSRNGVTSLSQESWKGHSYTFVATPHDTPLPPTAETSFERAPAHGTPPLESGTPL
jgi:hypothetical protein